MMTVFSAILSLLMCPHLAFNIHRSTGRSYYNSSNKGRENSRFSRNRGRGSFSTKGHKFHQQISSGSSVTGSYNSENKLICQICGKQGHYTLKCWHMLDNVLKFTYVTKATTHVTKSHHHLL